MGEPRETTKMIDDAGGIYKRASEAFEAGRARGRNDFFVAVQHSLARISAEQESGAVSGPNEPIFTRGFHVAQACAGAVRKIKDSFDARTL